jgi:CDP-2,3-bis-(O-geranylgeranyl)-sn-glycerol synthase
LRWLAGWKFRPLDGGWILPDGRPLFGQSKSWQGIFCSLAACTFVAALISLPMRAGLYVAIAAMIGDLVASFIKRRLGIASSAPAPGLDQLPEALLPILAVRNLFPLTISDGTLVLTAFIVGEMAIAAILQRFGWRDPPF